MVLESLYSAPITAMAGDTLAPAKVLNVRFTVEQGKVNLAWDAVVTNADGTALTDLTAYRIYRKDDVAGTFTAIASVAATVGAQVTVFTDNTMFDGASYIYAVSAIDDEPTPNESTLSDDLAVKTIPSVPQNLAATSGDKVVHLTWNSVKDVAHEKANENLAGYRVYRKLAADANYTFVAAVQGDVNVFDDQTVDNQVSYNYVVTAIDNSI